MVRKKRRVARRKPAVIVKSSIKSAGNVIFSKFKFGIVFKNLLLFVLLSIISYILWLVSSKDVFVDLFYFLWVIFGFISLAFFIALLVLLVLKWMKK